MKYKAEGVPLVVLAGAEYGTGSSRDWAAKGTYLLGVRAVIAASFERIHRSNLVGMGVLPLEFPAGQTWQSLGPDRRRNLRLPRPGRHAQAAQPADRRAPRPPTAASRNSTPRSASIRRSSSTTTATAASCRRCCESWRRSRNRRLMAKQSTSAKVSPSRSFLDRQLLPPVVGLLLSRLSCSATCCCRRIASVSAAIGRHVGQRVATEKPANAAASR